MTKIMLFFVSAVFIRAGIGFFPDFKQEKKSIHTNISINKKNALKRNLNDTERYIERFKKVAISEMKIFGIPASITLAQGILESNNGNSDLAKIDNNHFGIKCKSKCIGCLCRNYKDDSPYDMFRVFPSAWWSYREHSKLLKNSPRYAALFKLKKTDYKGWAIGLQSCGYATSKKYAQSLIRIIEKYKLYKFDN